MNIYKIMVFLAFNFLILIGCNTNQPGNSNEKLNLTVEETSSTEAWLSLSTSNITFPAETQLLINSEPGGNFTLTSQDTLLYVDSLLPNKSYEFRAKISGENITSKTAAAHTMDTTSHNFSWEKKVFGAQPTSRFNDVEIISEDNIWVVGEIYTEDSNTFDSNGVWIEPYNAVHWDGESWELRRIKYYGNCSAVNYPPLYDIWAQDDTTIAVTNGGSIGWFNCKNTQLDCRFNSSLKGVTYNIWGKSRSNIYISGSEGDLFHKDGNKWSKIETGTNLSINDIEGDSDGNIYAVGQRPMEDKGIVLKEQNNEFKTMIKSDSFTGQANLFTQKLYGSLQCLWLDRSGGIYTGGYLLYRYKYGKWGYVESLPENYIGGNSNNQYRGNITDIHGNAINDYFIVGTMSTLQHFNGSTWKQVGIPYEPYSDIAFHTIKAKGNIAVAAGAIGYKAIIVTLRRK
jgi:hypothetical protein